MASINPRAVNSGRGQHPDLDADGNDAVYPDPWDQRFAKDPSFSGAFMEAVAAEQSALPLHIQDEVAGRTFGPGSSVSDGLDSYNAYVKDRLHDERMLLRGEWHLLPPERQDELAAEGWQVHDPFNKEGKVDLRQAEQWDPFTRSEYAQAAAHNRTRER